MGKPSHVSPGDPAIAGQINGLMDWVGSPLEMPAWGAGYLSTPPAGAQLIQMMGYSALTTNSTGAVTITLPMAFPNGLAWWEASSAGGAGINFRTGLTGANASTVVFVAYAGTAVVASAAVNLIWTAVGW